MDRLRDRLIRLRDRLRSGVRRLAPFAGGVLATLLGLFLFHTLVPGPQPLTTAQVDQSIASAMASATPPPAYSAGVYQVIQPSLVLIQGSLPVTDTNHPESSLGSGVVIDDQGDILTSLHVVSQDTSIMVTFADGTQSSAQIFAKQPEIDIAVLRADHLPSVLVPAVLGNPNAMRVGDEAYAVGNPFGLYSSLSAGVISGFNRTFKPSNSDVEIKGMIQIDTAVNPGNSGGPLLNRAGQVIGIVEGIVNPTGEGVFIGIGFAIPINSAVGALGGSPPD